jgi:hypothetical protein
MHAYHVCCWSIFEAVRSVSQKPSFNETRGKGGQEQSRVCCVYVIVQGMSMIEWS